MISESTKKSLSAGFRSLKNWISIFGIVVAIVAVLNFTLTLVEIKTSVVLTATLNTYRAIFHQLIDFITWPISLTLPWYLKDAVTIYLLVGGGFMRARLAEGLYPVEEDAGVFCAVKLLFISKNELIRVPRTGNRLNLAYSASPGWMKKLVDSLLWPRVARQYLQWPQVYINYYNGSLQTFKSGYKPGGIKIFQHDRRLIFIVQLLAVLLGVICTLLLNGFLVAPA